jgi:hypothetical protein
MGISKSPVLYCDGMKPGCIGNNLPAPTNLTKNPDGKKNFFETMQLKNRPRWCLAEFKKELEPTWPIFEKCSHLREKGGMLTLRTPHWVCADPYSRPITG